MGGGRVSGEMGGARSAAGGGDGHGRLEFGECVAVGHGLRMRT